MESRHYGALSTLLNTTYGRGGSLRGDQSVKAEFQGDHMVLTFTSVVHFAEERSLQLQVDRLNQESVARLGAVLKQLRKDFKDATGDTLRTKEVRSNDSIELVSGLSQRKVAYYRRAHILELL